jgi:phenylalanyl-tRNA synthetase beta subunit
MLLHMNIEKLKVNKFLFRLNVIIRAKVRILMPQNLHDVVQKALIVEEDLISEGQSRTPERPTRPATYGAQQHQTPVRHVPGY